MRAGHLIRAFNGIVGREMLRFLQQRERFFAAMVRPLIWLVVFAAGFRAALGVNIQPPYETYITYQVYITPGLLAMIQLFNGMQSSLSMVYDREMGSMRVLLTTPLPRSYLLFCRLFGSVLVSLVQAYAFLLVAYLFGIDLPTITLRLTEEGGLWTLPDPVALLAVLPALILTGMLFGAMGMVISSTIKQLENFAGVMNFVIFPMFFMSSALYPLWRMNEASPWLYWACQLNPFTHAVEAIRFSLYLEWNPMAYGITATVTVVLSLLATAGFRPQRTRILAASKPA